MHRSVSRRGAAARLAIAAAVTLGVIISLTAPAMAAMEPEHSANLLDQPIVDLAVLAPDIAGLAPRLLTLQLDPDASGRIRAAILRRDDVWRLASRVVVDLPSSDSGAFDPPWLIGLSAASFALIAVEPGADRTVVVGLRTDGGPRGFAPEEGDRQVLPIAIEAAGAADVDGDGAPELVLTATSSRQPELTCAGSDVWVLDGITLVIERTFTVPERRLASGVLGRFDETPGDDLLAYAAPGCPVPPEGVGDLSLVGVRLIDGNVFVDRAAVSSISMPSTGSPLRLDIDDDGADEVMALTPQGLAVMDPRNDWQGTRVASAQAVPLFAGLPLTRGGEHAAAVAWLEPSSGRGPGSVGTEHIRRDPVDGGLHGSSATVMFAGGMTEHRWSLIQATSLANAQAGRPSVAWRAAIADQGCPDVLLPGAVLTCDAGDLRPGAAWFATRPVTFIGDGPARRLLVASGVGWDPERTVPDTPAPWAAAPIGWWRHGPSTPFVLAELPAGDALYVSEVPAPGATIESVTAPDLSTTIAGSTGSRFVVTATALAEAAIEASTEVDLAGALGALGAPLASTARAGVTRVPVPHGGQSGVDAGAVSVSLDEVTLIDGSPATRWIVTVVPIDDWGEVGDPVAGAVRRDLVGPALVIEAPFSSAVWPFTAEIAGSAETGAVIRLDGTAQSKLDPSGRFTVRTPLAPWPQTLRITATDASGNVTVRELSVVGGIDYRSFPWPLIAAITLLVVTAVFGLRGAAGSRSMNPRPSIEIEDLPPATKPLPADRR